MSSDNRNSSNHCLPPKTVMKRLVGIGYCTDLDKRTLYHSGSLPEREKMLLLLLQVPAKDISLVWSWLSFLHSHTKCLGISLHIL